MTTAPDGLFQYGGQPVSSGDTPSFGSVWFVDGTKGSVGGDGRALDDPISTVTLGLAAQVAETTSRGDIVYVMPGSYAESVTGDLSKVQIIGVTGGGAPHATSIRPTTSYAYTGSMLDSAFRNLMFLSPATSSKTLAAVQPTYMGYSIIDNCLFIGRDGTCIEGLQIGTISDASTVVKCDYSRITNNVFSTFYGTGQEFIYGIKIGYTSMIANDASKQMFHSLIAGNRIIASTGGIWIGCGPSKCTGTVIAHNHVSGFADAAGPTYGIWASAYGDAGMHNMQVYRNTINAKTDAIYGFFDECVFDNFVSLNLGAPTGENPDHT